MRRFLKNIFLLSITTVILLMILPVFLFRKSVQLSLPMPVPVTLNPSPKPAVKGIRTTPSATPTLVPKPKISTFNKLFDLVNQYRSQKGLKSLVIYSPLCQFSQTRLEQIKNDWSHNGYDQAAEQGQLFSLDCPNCSRVGENLAKDYPDEEAVLQAWLASDYHRNNLEGDWDWGCAASSGNFAVFLFGKKK